MAHGFDNTTLYCDNVDFRGVSPVEPQMIADGQLLIGSSVAPQIRAGLMTSLDGSVTITVGNGTIDLAAVGGGGGSAVVNVTTATQAMAVNTQYIANNVSAKVVFTLPAVAAVGSKVSVQGSASFGWRISQNAGQVINFGDVATTTGTSGYLEFVNRYDSIELMCIVANTTWASTGKGQGLAITVA
jgi:hypothetical protein